MPTAAMAPARVIHPARSGPRPLTAEDLWRLPRVGAPAPAPDGAAAVVPVTQWDLDKNQSRTRLWWVPLEGAARPLTSDEFSSAEPAVSPDGRRVAFTRKKDGGRAQLMILPLDGGEPTTHTDLPLGVFDPQWLPDGSGLVFGSMLIRGHLTPQATKAEVERRDKDPVKAYVTEDRFYRYWDTWLTTGEVPHLFHLDLATGALRDLTPDAEWWFDWMDPAGNFDLAPDGSEVAVSGIEIDPATGNIRTYVWLLAVAGGAPRCITLEHPADDLRPRYSPDGTWIAYGMQHDQTFYADRVRLMRYDRKAATHAELAADWTLSASHWEFAADGTLMIEAEDEARVSLFRLRGTGTPERVLHGGTVSGVAPAGGRVWCVRQNLVSPPEVYVWGADGSANESPNGSNARRVTSFTDAGAAQFGVGEVRELSFEGAYGEKIQMYVVMPPGHTEGSKPPLVHVVHGGPHAISGDGFHWRWNAQLFAAPGYAVALVNFQGSTSWGQDFAQRILGGWGDRPYGDVMKATDLLVESGLVDGTRMALAGGSYGGYMAAWVAGHTDRFRCIVNHAGVYDTLGQYASDVTQGRGRAFGGEPWDAAGIAAIDKFNPARFTNGMTTPMLVIHGERDYRVPVTQGLECYGMLKAKGIPARLVYFPDENHWVLKAQNSLLWYREVHNWLARWLGTDA